MPRDKGNVDVAALADGLAVVHRLQNRETARVLLHLPRQSIQIARALMAAQRLPCRKSLARRGDGGFHVVIVALGHLGQHFAGRRIAGGLVLAARRRDPRAADELLKPAMVPLQPLTSPPLGSSGAAPYSMV